MGATTTGTGTVPETLFGALAAFQASLPKIAKGETANVPTKQGGSYSYKYADLTDVSEAVLPRLGALGLAFIARPTSREDGKFGLAYSLVHVSGEREDGFYEIHINGMTPQQIGGLITYARRYCLCAATGTAPGGDDDDASGAQQVAIRQSAGDAWEDAAPARPMNQGPRRETTSGQRGQVSRPTQSAASTTPATASPEDIDPDAQAFADEAHQALIIADVERIHKQARDAGKVAALVKNPSSGGVGKLAVYLDWRRKNLKEVGDALAELTAAALEREVDDLDGFVKAVIGTDLDSATAPQMRMAAKTLREKEMASA